VKPLSLEEIKEETENWKNYHHTLPPFTFKYPNDFVVKNILPTTNGKIFLIGNKSFDLRLHVNKDVESYGINSYSTDKYSYAFVSNQIAYLDAYVSAEGWFITTANIFFDDYAIKLSIVPIAKTPDESEKMAGDAVRIRDLILATLEFEYSEYSAQSGNVISYGDLGSSSNNQTVEFTNTLEKIRFTYPQKYKKIVFDNTLTRVFFYLASDIGTEKRITDEIECQNSPYDPNTTGVCAEGQVADIEVFMHKTSLQAINDISKDLESKKCIKDFVGVNKTIYSCQRQLSINPFDFGMEYHLYITENQPKRITLSVRSPKQYEDLVTQIVNSAEVLP